MTDPSFLIVRLGSLGDLVHTLPAVAGLRETFPNVRMIWLTHPRWEPLIVSSALVSDVWVVDSRDTPSVRATLRRIREAQFQTAIDYQGLWKAAALPLLAGVKRRIGFSNQTVREFGVPVLYTDRVRVTSRHIADQNGELSMRAGAKQAIGRVRLRVDPSAEQRLRETLQLQGISNYVVLSPGGGWRSKCWPAERFGVLARRIGSEMQMRCLINFAPGEEDLVAATQAAAGDARPIPVTGSLPELMALLRGAACVVAGDTGPLHLADALGTPVVALFGPTNPERNGPYFGNGVTLRAPKVESTYKRHDQPHPSLLQLSVDEVFAAVQRAGSFS